MSRSKNKAKRSGKKSAADPQSEDAADRTPAPDAESKSGSTADGSSGGKSGSKSGAKSAAKSRGKSSRKAKSRDAGGQPKPKRRVARLLGLLAITLVVALVAAWLLAWYQERALVSAEQALAAGDPQTALKVTGEFLAQHPGNTRAMALRGRALVAVRQPAEALKLFHQAGTATVPDLQAMAEAYLMQEQWSLAEPILGRLLQLAPDHPDGLYEITTARVRLGKLKEALPTAQRFASLPGHEPRGYVFVGTIHGDLGNFDEAAKAYRKVLEVRPDASDLQVAPHEFLLEFGRALLRSGNPEEAVQHLQTALRLQESAEGHVLSGKAQDQMGRTTEAIQSWQAALKLETTNVEARELLANAALARQAPREALEWLNPLTSSPALQASTAYLFQRAHTLLKDRDAADRWRTRTERLRAAEKVTAAINNVLLESPDSFWAQVIKAHRFAADGNWPQAEAILIRLARDKPSDAFFVALAKAVQTRGPLPPLSGLPIQQF